ncbi:hypothetical protein FQN57_002658 [Myotisia sp. PD_48]|nr:hypothetical protein FQN57_002658 [Myotisia sp. PD_48]
MAHLIELISGSSATTPGWAYVPNTKYNNPVGKRAGRKRAAREIASGPSDLTSRQRGAIVKHLSELDKENHKDVHIPVPARQNRENAPKGTRSKTSSNVRKILNSQKTFKNHLDDERANPSSAPGTTVTTQRARTLKPTTTTTATTGVSDKNTASPSKRTVPALPKLEASSVSNATPALPSSQLITSDCDHDPLLQSYIPTKPSDRIMQALLSEPPLSYEAARASLPPASKPPRHFCTICGYWGKVKCIKCHARVCGLECSRIHDETRCDRFYA